MILKKAINRLAWRFTPQGDNDNPNKFQPNDNDLDAVNDIIEWVNRQKELTTNNNKLFAKLYIYFLDNEIKKHNTTVFDDIPQKQLSRILTTPLHLFYKSFKNSFNHNLTKEFFENHDIIIDGKKRDDKEKINKISDDEIKEWLNHSFYTKEEKKDLKGIISDDYDLLFIEKELNEMVSEALNRFSNYA